MRAIKKGLIYETNNWAQCPVVDDLGTKLRIYYSARGCDGRSFITYIEVHALDPSMVLYEHKAPIIGLGDNGMFDQDGMIPSCIRRIGTNKFLYYTGWSRKLSVPYENQIGMLKVNGNFHQRLYKGPIIGKSRSNPIFTGSLLIQNDYLGSLDVMYKGFYISCNKWVNGEPYYSLRSAKSINGIDWDSHENEIDLVEGEGGICSPALHGVDKMTFCVRGNEGYRLLANKSYSIQWAQLENNKWIRKGSLPGLEKSESGWDSQMVCYPYIHKDFIFYNGNNFGRSGIGFAQIQQ